MFFTAFFKYFVAYIFRARTRQRLLFLALFSLFLSSFALMVLQGVMSGLQNSLIKRSKSIEGAYYIDISFLNEKEQKSLLEDFKDYELSGFYPEKETELLIRHQSHIAPMILHGVDFKNGVPPFLEDYPTQGIILGADLSRKIQAYYDSELQLVTPSAMDNLLGDIPRSVTSKLEEIIQTDVNEIDILHGWARKNFVFNLLKEKTYNKVRFQHIDTLEKVKKILANHCPKDCDIYTWERKHHSLQWALNLESRVMLFLFTAMSFLVAISITAGLLIFYGKIKIDLASYWIMGMSKEKLYTLIAYVTYILNGLACFMGVFLGCLLLIILENYSHDLIPSIFVERSLPVEISFKALSISFMIPMGIAFIFSHLSIRYILKDEHSFLKMIKGKGQ